MVRFSLYCCAFVACFASAAEATPTIINLSASLLTANTGPSSYQTYAPPNPISIALAAGTYNVSVVGVAGGGTYDAFSLDIGNNNFSDGWHYSIGSGSDNAVVTGTNYSTAALALAAYSARTPTTFTLATAQTVNFYLNDASFPYFADDSGGVSLALSAVPEPATLAVLGIGLGTAAWLRRRRREV